MKSKYYHDVDARHFNKSKQIYLYKDACSVYLLQLGLTAGLVCRVWSCYVQTCCLTLPVKVLLRLTL